MTISTDSYFFHLIKKSKMYLWRYTFHRTVLCFDNTMFTLKFKIIYSSCMASTSHYSDMKNISKISIFKTSTFGVVWIIRVCSHFYVWRDLKPPMSAIATIAGKSFNGNFLLQKLLLYYRLFFCYNCWCCHWKSEVSPYIIW